MKISYARLFNLGNYENERIEIEDEVLPNETPKQAYHRIRAELFASVGRKDPEAPPDSQQAGEEEIPF